MDSAFPEQSIWVKRSGPPDCSWNKIVIAKANNEWTSSIKTEQVAENNIMNTSNFSMSEEQEASFPEIKVENEVIAFPSSSYPDDGELSDATSSSMDPLLADDNCTPKRRRRKGSGPKLESPDERAVRLAKMSAYAAQRLANETPDQRALRLKRMSQYAARRLSQETSEQRAKRLARMSAYAAKRLAGESPEQRQARLARMSAYAAKRHAIKKFMGTHKLNESEFSQS